MKKFHKICQTANGPAFDSLLLAIIQIVTYASGILTTKILSIALSLTEYGTYSTVNSIITIAASLTLFGLGDTINYYYNKRTSIVFAEQREEYINTIFFIQLCIGVTVGVALIAFSGAISDYYDNPLVQSLLWLVCFKPFLSNATHLYQVLFVSDGKAKLIAIRNLIISVSKVLLIYVAVKLSESLFMIFGFLTLLDIFQLFAFRYIFGTISFRVHVFSFRRDKLVPIMKYTIPMGVYFVTTTLMREIDKLVIGRLGTTEMLAVYTNCAKSLPLNFLTTAFATVLIPYIMKSVSGSNYQVTVQILKKYLSVGYLTVWMFSGALLLCAPEAIRFFYSDSYIAGLPIFVVYILDTMVQFASVHLVIAASGNSKFLMETSLTLLILNAVFSVVMYKIMEMYGMALLGPAVVTLLMSILYVYALYRKSAQILHRKVSDFLPIKGMVLYLCELLAIGVAFYGIKLSLQALHIHWCLLFITEITCYCAIVALLHIKEYKKLFMEINQLKRSDM